MASSPPATPTAEFPPTAGALVFDFDGTLVDSRIDFPLMRRRVAEHLAGWGLEPEPAAARMVLEAVDWARERLATDSPERAERYYREAQAVIWEVERPFCERAEPFPGVPEALAQARAAGRRLGIITRNSAAGVALVLARHPLPVEAIVSREDLAQVKPHPAHLLLALQRLGVAPERAWMIGDHPTDIVCGQAAGARTGAVLTTGTSAEEFRRLSADLVCADAAELVRQVLTRDEQP
jgi:phosphoglycolate phosphatase